MALELPITGLAPESTIPQKTQKQLRYKYIYTHSHSHSYTHRWGWLRVFNISQRLRPLSLSPLLRVWPPKSEVGLVTLSLLSGPPEANAWPAEETEHSLAAPQRSQDTEQHSTHKPQTACFSRVLPLIPTILQKVIPELGVWPPGTIARHFPCVCTLRADLQILFHVIHQISLPHLPDSVSDTLPSCAKLFSVRYSVVPYLYLVITLCLDLLFKFYCRHWLQSG